MWSQEEYQRLLLGDFQDITDILGELIEAGVERISSNDLSSRMKVTASQIRQDLNNFGGFRSAGIRLQCKVSSHGDW